jgi:hypothetical protein
MIKASKKLKADTNAQQALKAFVRKMYNEPEKVKLTKAKLTYQEFLYFILDKNQNAQHLKMKKMHANLTKWKQDGHPTGLQLWKGIVEQNKEKFNKDSMIFKYPQNQRAIKESLKIADRLTDDPYSLTYKELQETLPHGLEQLDAILSEVHLKKEEGDIKLLKTYCGFIKMN